VVGVQHRFTPENPLEALPALPREAENYLRAEKWSYVSGSSEATTHGGLMQFVFSRYDQPIGWEEKL
jgi:hypothetical protein